MYFLILISLLLFQSCQKTATNQTEKFNAPYVILISIDGYRSDYTDMYSPPTLSYMKRQGLSATRLIPVYPSLTFPNHYSIITGLFPENHNLISNEFYDRKSGRTYSLGNRKEVADGRWYGGTPLWNAIQNSGNVTASYFWVGSEAKIQGMRPDYYKKFNSKIPHEKRIDEIVTWLKLPKEKRPHFINLYFGDVDVAGHRYGPKSEQVKQAVHKVDHSIKKLMERIKKLNLPINFVIVSDHGMRKISSKKVLYLADYISLENKIITGRGSSFQIYFKNISELEATRKALSKVPLLETYTKKSLPKKWHYSNSPMTGDLIISTKASAYMKKVRSPGKKGKSGATHGYVPEDELMGGIFYAYGPKVKAGKVSAFQNVHIYPFVMGLMGISYNHKIDGDPQVLNKYIK